MEKRGMQEALSGQGLTVESKIGWSDEFRFGLCGSTSKVLAPRGVKVRQKVQLDRDWYDLAVVVDGVGGTLSWAWIEGTKGDQIAPAVRQWQSEGFEALVWDGHGGHKTRSVRDVGVVLVEQPPKSPELNPAERVGEAIRARIEGKTYKTIYRKMAVVEEVLTQLGTNPEAIKRLAGWDWIVQSQQSLPHRGMT